MGRGWGWGWGRDGSGLCNKILHVRTMNVTQGLEYCLAKEKVLNDIMHPEKHLSFCGTY